MRLEIPRDTEVYQLSSDYLDRHERHSFGFGYGEAVSVMESSTGGTRHQLCAYRGGSEPGAYLMSTGTLQGPWNNSFTPWGCEQSRGALSPRT